MKILVIIRHGQSEKKTDEKSDQARELVDQGIKELERVAGQIKNHSMTIDLMMASLSRRTMMSAAIIARVIGYPEKNIVFHKLLYEQAGMESILGLLGSTNDRVDSLMLIGHNPSCEELIRRLVPSFAAKVPPAGAVGIGLGIDSWGEIETAKGDVLFEYFP